MSLMGKFLKIWKRIESLWNQRNDWRISCCKMIVGVEITERKSSKEKKLGRFNRRMRTRTLRSRTAPLLLLTLLITCNEQRAFSETFARSFAIHATITIVTQSVLSKMQLWALRFDFGIHVDYESHDAAKRNFKTLQESYEVQRNSAIYR